jgi:hypothetical protein
LYLEPINGVDIHQLGALFPQPSIEAIPQKLYLQAKKKTLTHTVVPDEPGNTLHPMWMEDLSSTPEPAVYGKRVYGKRDDSKEACHVTRQTLLGETTDKPDDSNWSRIQQF